MLTHNRERLDVVELKPFRAAIENGVEMIMTAHIAFPTVDNEHVTSLKDGSSVPIPATLSRKVLNGLLREELGYKGIIISDAFTMNAIAEHFGENQAVERAVSAGVDIILMPQDPAVAHQTLVNAVNSGRIPTETIHNSVKRILKLKSEYGLFDRSKSIAQKLNALNGVIGSEEHRAVERQIAERAVTVLASRGGALPDQIQHGDHVVIVAAEQEQAKQLERQLTQAAGNLSLKTGISVIGPGKTAEALKVIDEADYVILASYQFRNVASQFKWSDYQTLI
ncbi:putative lipoprotein YbbD precursor [compost metagenome]